MSDTIQQSRRKQMSPMWCKNNKDVQMTKDVICPHRITGICIIKTCRHSIFHLPEINDESKITDEEHCKLDVPYDCQISGTCKHTGYLHECISVNINRKEQIRKILDED